jgi:hypothetical protein
MLPRGRSGEFFLRFWNRYISKTHWPPDLSELRNSDILRLGCISHHRSAQIFVRWEVTPNSLQNAVFRALVAKTMNVRSFLLPMLVWSRSPRRGRRTFSGWW